MEGLDMTVPSAVLLMMQSPSNLLVQIGHHADTTNEGVRNRHGAESLFPGYLRHRSVPLRLAAGCGMIASEGRTGDAGEFTPRHGVGCRAHSEQPGRCLASISGPRRSRPPCCRNRAPLWRCRAVRQPAAAVQNARSWKGGIAKPAVPLALRARGDRFGLAYR